MHQFGLSADGRLYQSCLSFCIPAIGLSRLKPKRLRHLAGIRSTAKANIIVVNLLWPRTKIANKDTTTSRHGYADKRSELRHLDRLDLYITLYIIHSLLTQSGFITNIWNDAKESSFNHSTRSYHFNSRVRRENLKREERILRARIIELQYGRSSQTKIRGATAAIHEVTTLARWTILTQQTTVRRPTRKPSFSPLQMLLSNLHQHWDQTHRVSSPQSAPMTARIFFIKNVPNRLHRLGLHQTLQLY